MTQALAPAEVAAWRAWASGLATEIAARPGPREAVFTRAAMQAQDRRIASWAVAQRTSGTTEAQMDRLCDDGQLLRTHVLRPTWHLVDPRDLRWLQRATAQRVRRTNRTAHRTFGVTADDCARAVEVCLAALEGGRSLTRRQLADAFAAAGLPHQGIPLAFLLMHAELEAVICSGPLRGRQTTYALCQDRIDATQELAPDDPVAELLRRYLSGHGPAALADISWWSSLPTRQLQAAVERLGDACTRWRVGDVDLIALGEPPDQPGPRPHVELLQAVDEHLVGFSRTRDLAADPALGAPLRGRTTNAVLLDAHVVGDWRWSLGRSEAVISVTVARPLDSDERHALEAAVARLGAYLCQPARLVLA